MPVLLLTDWNYKTVFYCSSNEASETWNILSTTCGCHIPDKHRRFPDTRSSLSLRSWKFPLSVHTFRSIQTLYVQKISLSRLSLSCIHCNFWTTYKTFFHFGINIVEGEANVGTSKSMAIVYVRSCLMFWYTNGKVSKYFASMPFHRSCNVSVKYVISLILQS